MRGTYLANNLQDHTNLESVINATCKLSTDMSPVIGNIVLNCLWDESRQFSSECANDVCSKPPLTSQGLHELAIATMLRFDNQV